MIPCGSFDTSNGQGIVDAHPYETYASNALVSVTCPKKLKLKLSGHAALAPGSFRKQIQSSNRFVEIDSDYQ